VFILVCRLSCTLASNTMSTFKSLRVFANLATQLASKEASPLVGKQPPSRHLSQCAPCLGRHGPKSVGIQGWVRERARRHHREMKLHAIPRTEYQLESEARLRAQDPVVALQPGYKPEFGVRLNTRNTVMISEDKQTIICYHPFAKEYPIEFTKPATQEYWWMPNSAEFSSYIDTIEEEQLAELKTLRLENPILWTEKALSHLFEVQPEVIRPHLRLPVELAEFREEQAKAIDKMPKSKRKRFRDKQQWDRLRYIHQTRGAEVAQRFRHKMEVPGQRSAVPPPKMRYSDPPVSENQGL